MANISVAVSYISDSATGFRTLYSVASFLEQAHFMEDVRSPIKPDSHRFMDKLRLFIRARHLAYKTEKTYCYWIKQFIRFHGRRNPEHMGEVEVQAFLNHIVTQRNVSPNTQKTALNALVFLYTKFFQRELKALNFTYSSVSPQLPTVFTHEEALAVIKRLDGIYKLAASIMYGSGLRV